jgi:hypothetical protein
MEILQPLRPDQELRARRFAEFLVTVETIHDLLGEGGDFTGNREPRTPAPPSIPPVGITEQYAPVIVLHPQPVEHAVARTALHLVRP